MSTYKSSPRCCLQSTGMCLHHRLVEMYSWQSRMAPLQAPLLRPKPMGQLVHEPVVGEQAVQDVAHAANSHQ